MDLILRNAKILDGSGAAAFEGDVGIEAGFIAAVGDVAAGGVAVGRAGAAAKEIDVGGKVLAPGFVDTHTHDDAALLKYPGLEFKLSQGCTSVVIGNCGFSAAPYSASQGQVPGNASLFAGLNPTWSDLSGYFAALQQVKPAVNTMALVGHNTIRWLVMGGDERAPTRDELQRMRGLVEQALEQGACGFSSGLIYRPGKHADTEELVALAGPLQARNAVYATHIRNEGDTLLEAVDEALAVGREAGCKVHISHHKAAGRRNWGKVKDSLARVDAANHAGLDVTLDMYPYTMGSGPMVEYFDLADINLELAQVMRIAKCPAFPSFEGRALSDIAVEQAISLADVVRKILTAELGAKTICIQLLVDEADLETNLRHPLMMVGSDGIADLEGKPHPRLFGTMPRILGEFVRKRGTLSLEEAVRRITSLACQRFGLRERGLVRPGYAADLVVFDPNTVADRATYDDSKQESVGIELVLVNGKIAYQDGKHTRVGSGTTLSFG